MARLYDVIIFGATGYTGQYVVEEVARCAKDENISWAVAGRNKEKLEKGLKEAKKHVTGNV